MRVSARRGLLRRRLGARDDPGGGRVDALFIDAANGHCPGRAGDDRPASSRRRTWAWIGGQAAARGRTAIVDARRRRVKVGVGPGSILPPPASWRAWASRRSPRSTRQAR
ncbi:hypothetical protein QJS66_20885 [Kocuria rhizophila]|nr:hypothetical protein QJS66_20885 [Kocuria rhizophila]